MFIEAPELASYPNLRHAFFTREGGVSSGIYASLNGGLGSSDARENVLRNRSIMAGDLGVAPEALLSLHQIHSSEVVIVDEPWGEDRPKADGMATRVPGLALAIATADCGPVLFADPHAGVVGACHAGWRGAFTGVLEATVVAMETLGARRNKIIAVLGPTISQAAYEVGPEFVEAFTRSDGDLNRFFVPSAKPDHAMFDLPSFIGARLEASGIGEFANTGLCTYSDPMRFYSYRRTTHQSEPDYGRLISAIRVTH
jgi:YfiH family protein